MSTRDCKPKTKSVGFVQTYSEKPHVNPSEEQQFHFMDLSLDCDSSFLKNLATHQVGTGLFFAASDLNG